MFGAALCFGVAVLTKETMLLFVPVVAWLVWLKTSPATRRYALAVFGAVCALVVGTYVLMALVRGELVPGPGHVSLWEGVKFQLWQRESSGSLTDPQSLKRHTIDEWLRLDPVLPLLAAPVAVGGLLVERLRPYAVGLLILVLAVVRPGYLPVPFVISAIPLIALLTAGLGAAVVDQVRRMSRQPSARAHRLRTTATLVVAFLGALTATLWVAGYRDTLGTDEDASMRQAQQWISDNVTSRDRLIVDDAMWVDLVRDGRDRRNVVWSYKVDTDEQVQEWAPRGWADYEWVVSTPSMRANMPDSGVLKDAMSHARPPRRSGNAATGSTSCGSAATRRRRPRPRLRRSGFRSRPGWTARRTPMRWRPCSPAPSINGSSPPWQCWRRRSPLRCRAFRRWLQRMSRARRAASSG